MAKFIQQGDTIDLVVAGSAVTAGTPTVIGDIFGVINADGAIGRTVGVNVTGVHELPKDTGVGTDIAAGKWVYWDAGDSEVTEDDTGNLLIGYTVKAAATTDATVRVNLWPVLIAPEPTPS